MLQAAASWILTYSLHSVAFCIGAMLVNRWRDGPAYRCVIWRAALIAPVITATISLPASANRETIAVAEPLRQFLPPKAARQEVLMDVRQTIGAAPVRKVIRTDPLAFGVSAAIVGIAVLIGSLGLVKLLAGRRTARKALRDTHVVPSFANAQQRGIELRTSDTLPVPVALTGRRIRIPSSSLIDLDRSALDAVLLHEIAHVERRDPEWIDFARFISAVTLWQPFNRRVLDALERDAELAADARAVRLGAQPYSLVAALAYFAGRLDMPTTAGTGFVRGDSPLVDRAGRILRGDAITQSRPGALAGLLAMIVLCAGLMALPAVTSAGSVNSASRPAIGPTMKLIEVERAEMRNGRQPLR